MIISAYCKEQIRLRIKELISDPIEAGCTTSDILWQIAKFNPGDFREVNFLVFPDLKAQPLTDDSLVMYDDEQVLTLQLVAHVWSMGYSTWRLKDKEQ